MHDAPTITDPVAFWEDFYQTKRTTSSGRPSSTLERIAATLPPGRSLDLGSSNGDDVIWLAGQGWQALGYDISSTAVDRARRRASDLTLTGSAKFETCDLSRGIPGGPFDLVTAFYLQSPVALDRAAILRHAAAAVAPGGHLLVVAHGAPPPWSTGHAADVTFPTVSGELDAIGYTPDAWDRLHADIVWRTAKGPDGQEAQLEDTLIHLRRR